MPDWRSKKKSLIWTEDANYLLPIFENTAVPIIQKKVKKEEETKEVHNKISNRISAFRIKDSLNEIVDSHKERTGLVKKINVLGNDSFTIDSLNEAISKYMAEYELDILLRSSLMSKKTIKDNTIIIDVENSLQYDAILAKKEELENYVSVELNNNKIEIMIMVNSEAPSLDEFVTDYQRLNYFIQINPAVSYLKEVFGLELE